MRSLQVGPPPGYLVLVVEYGVRRHAGLALCRDGADVEAGVETVTLQREVVFGGLAPHCVAIDIANLAELADRATDGLAGGRDVAVVKLEICSHGPGGESGEGGEDESGGSAHRER